MSRDPLAEVAADVAEGRPVEWSSVSASTPPEDAAALQALRSLESLREPRRWGALVLLEQIGRGGQGDVFRAWEPELERPVALKLSRWHSAEPDVASLDEARRLARLRHPNVVRVLGVAHHDGRTGLWMDLVSGPTVEDVVSEGGAVRPELLVRWSRDLCEAVASVHAAGLVHGDISARNVVVDRDGRLVLMDFGLGRSKGSPAAAAAGTRPYAAPELLAGRAPSPASDVHALGVLLRYASCGAHDGQPARALEQALAPSLADDPRRRPDPRTLHARLERAATPPRAVSLRRAVVGAVALGAVVVSTLPVAAPGGVPRDRAPVASAPEALPPAPPRARLPRTDPFDRQAPELRTVYTVSARRSRASGVERLVLQASRPLDLYLLGVTSTGSVSLAGWTRLPSLDETGRMSWEWRPRPGDAYYLVGSPDPIPELEKALVDGEDDLQAWRERLGAAPLLGETMVAHTSSWIRRL